MVKPIILLTLFTISTVTADIASAVETKTNSITDGVVTIQASAKTSTVEGAKASVLRVMRAGEGVQAVVLNDTDRKQVLKVRFNQLELPTYDVYINGSFAGSRANKELEAGIDVPAPGCTLLEYKPIMSQIAAGAAGLVARLRTQGTPETTLIASKLANIQSWSTVAAARVRNSGGVCVILSPSERAVPTMMPWLTPTPSDVTISTARYWAAISYERSAIYQRVKDPELVSLALSAVTPMDTTAHLHSDKAPRVTCALVNQCEAQLSGKLVLEGVPGTKPPTPIPFKSLGRGKSFQASFNLTGLPASAKLDALKVRAEITVGAATFVKTVPVTVDGQGVVRD